MTNKLMNTFLTLVALASLFCPRVQAEPMDGKAAESLPCFQSLASDVKLGKTLTPKQIDSLREGLRSGDPVLTSIAAWCIGEMGEQGDGFEPDLSAVKAKDDSMARAFVTLAQAGRSSRSASAAERIRRFTNLAGSSNPYLKVEAAKVLVKLDRQRGKKFLIQLARDKDSVSRASASRVLRAMQLADGETPVLPIPSGDELYETVLSVIQQPVR